MWARPCSASAAGDSYVKLCAEHQNEFPDNVIAPYISGELMNTLINKEKFYALCDQYGLDHPATVIHRREMGHDFSLPFDPALHLQALQRRGILGPSL